MRRIVAAAGVTLLAVAVCAGAAQKEPAPSRIKQLNEWIAAARAHEPGKSDRPLTTIAGWSNGDIRTLWTTISVLLQFVQCGQCSGANIKGLDGKIYGVPLGRVELKILRLMADDMRALEANANILVKRGAILHADIVMLAQSVVDERAERPEPPPPIPAGARRSGEPLRPAPVPERIVLRSTDGQQDSLVRDAVHLDLAYALLDSVVGRDHKPAPQDDEDVRHWYHATIAYFQAIAMHDQHHFDRALRLFPTDPDVQFQAGCLHESLASPRVQAVMRTASLPTGVSMNVRSERAELETAEQFFRRALDLDPSFAEARLRLGRTLGLLGKHAEAVAEFLRMPDRVDHIALTYFQQLFLGAEEEALGNRQEARAAYLRARDLFPLAQSPPIALSHLARETGDRGDALAAIQRVLGLPEGEVNRRDPYWVYHFFQGRHLDDRLDALYQPFRPKAP